MRLLRRVGKLHLGLVGIALLIPVGGLGQSPQSDEALVWPESKLEIELAIDNQAYSMGEPIMVTVTLRNTGEGPFIASKSPTTMQIGSGGVVSLELLGPDGRPIEGITAIGEFWGLQGLGYESWIISNRRVYVPGDFVGFSRSLEMLGYSIKEPGHYELKATYWETDLSGSGWVDEKEIEKSKKKLRVPLWVGTITSEPVSFEVQP